MLKKALRALAMLALKMVLGPVGFIALLILPWALLGAAIYFSLQPTYGPQLGPATLGWRLSTGVATVAGLFMILCAAWSEKRVRADLRGITTTTETDGQQAVSEGKGKRGGGVSKVLGTRGMTGRVVDSTSATTLDIADRAAASLTCAFAFVTVGWTPGLWAFAAAVVCAPMAAWAVARRVGAVKRVDLAVGEAYRVVTTYGFPTLPVVVSAAVAGGVWGLLAVFAGDPPIALAVFLVVTAAGTTLGQRAVTALRDETENRGSILSALALALGSRSTEVDALHWRIAPDDSITITGRIPESILSNRRRHEELFSEHLPDYEVEEIAAKHITIRPVTEAKRVERETLAATRGFVLAVEPLTAEEIF